MGRKAISPIIAIIIILLITIAIAGAAYSYLSVYWGSLTGKQIEVLDSLCAETGHQVKVLVRNIGTDTVDTSEIRAIDGKTGQDLTGDVLWEGLGSGSGRVLELRFDDEDNQGVDTSGKGNDGTVSGATWEGNGNIGGALSFGGSGFVNVGSDSSLQTSVFTYAAFVNPSGSGSRTIMGNENDAVQFRVDAGNTLSLLHQGAEAIGTSTGTVINGIWSHVAVTYDSSGNYAFYIDGSPAGSGADAGHPRTFAWGDFYIGKITDAGDEFFSGLMDEVQIYNRVLSPGEIESIAENSFAMDQNERALMRHTCEGFCKYSIILGGSAKEAMVNC